MTAVYYSCWYQLSEAVNVLEYFEFLRRREPTVAV